ncbi:hypothetical protein Ccel01_17750 [Cellulosimicrobium cellulans]|uniref:Uncharacterized protein n=1 Tax=Cellulosimicrobium cellulans TaxID=1710 RepID=A0AAV5P6F1_CELCE|nr:hypothetical protein Ccel01_17750 [Cellulosimicrobium cellulans]
MNSCLSFEVSRPGTAPGDAWGPVARAGRPGHRWDGQLRTVRVRFTVLGATPADPW